MLRNMPTLDPGDIVRANFWNNLLIIQNGRKKLTLKLLNLKIAQYTLLLLHKDNVKDFTRIAVNYSRMRSELHRLVFSVKAELNYG